MKPQGLVAGLDLGTTKTCAVIAEARGDHRLPSIRVLGVGTAKGSGVRRGLVRDLEETTRSITQALSDAERMAGVKVPLLYCGIAGEHVAARSSVGLGAITGQEISKDDLKRVDDSARAVNLGTDQELLHDIPQEYKVDSQGGISDPLGMTGLRLEVDMYLVSVQSTAIQNLRKSVERAGYRVAEVVLESLAASLAVLAEEEKELGCVLVEMGGGSTNVAVFRDGKIRFLWSCPFASGRVTSDIVQGLQVTQADAERLKEKYGVAYEPLVNPQEELELPSTPGQGARTVKREMLAHIIHQRVDEIFHLVSQQIEGAGFAGRLPAGVVLTGGGAHMQGVVDLAREVFAMPARVGEPTRGISGLVDSVQAPRYAVPVGLALYGARLRVGSGAEWDGMDRLLAPVKRWLQDFF